MSDKNHGGDKKNINDGYAPLKKGYQPTSDNAIGGHKPEKSQLKPINPPKKK